MALYRQQIHWLNNLSGSKKVKTTNGIDEDAEHFYDLNTIRPENAASVYLLPKGYMCSGIKKTAKQSNCNHACIRLSFQKILPFDEMWQLKRYNKKVSSREINLWGNPLTRSAKNCSGTFVSPKTLLCKS